MSVILTATCHPGLQGERVCPHHGKERAQPLGLTDSLLHLGPPPLGPRHLGPANLALFSHATAALSTGLLGKDQYPTVFLSPQSAPPVLGLSNLPVTVFLQCKVTQLVPDVSRCFDLCFLGLYGFHFFSQ